jgi:hypothetical protein
MSRALSTLVGGLLLFAAATAAQSQPAVEQRQQRYQIGVMERVLEEAVEHGANLTRDRLQSVVPADMLVSEGARVRGFRIESYGMFFDVEVPTLLYQGTLPWMFRTLDQNDLGLASALETLRAVVQKAGDTNLEQALKRVELQVAPVAVGANSSVTPAGSMPQPTRPGARVLTGSAATTSTPRAAAATDPILDDPEEAYRAEVRNALMDAMLDYSRGLSLETGEWLHIAARRHSDDPRLAPTDTDARTVMIRVRGADLTQFLAGQISREEARKRMDVKVF